MYKFIIRPLFFLINPESIHHFLIFIIRWGFRIPGVRLFVKKTYTIKDPRLERKVFGISFPSPVGFAAGFDKNAEIYNDFAAFGFGFIEIGTLTPRAQSGNPRPRLFRVTADNALINRMGFNNVGVGQAVKNLRKREPRVIIGGNIGKNTNTPNEQAVDDYAFCFNALYDYVDYFAVNVSCPNITDLTELQDKDNLLSILSRLIGLRKTKPTRKPVLLKISPDLNWQQIDDVLEICGSLEIDGIVATNTTIRRENLTIGIDEIGTIGRGGLSGSPLTQRSTEIIRYINQKTEGKLPIIGVGGIMSVEDALEKLDAGASLIQVYTGYIYEGPGFVKRINKTLLRRS
ncbi:MAG: quinone-dependent dihydroorotate dehydrogenase [Bacteroidales bacterium]